MSALPGREHHWDALRAVLMLLGIPYHAAMAYNARVLWDVQSPDKSEILTVLSGLLVTFRMPAFFIVAGYFAAMMLARRSPMQWMRSRLVRLGIPFITGLILLAPLQIVFIDLTEALNGHRELSTVWTRAVFDATHPGFNWIMHLWFLPALLAYSLLLALGWQLNTPGRSSASITRLRDSVARQPALLLALLAGLSALWEVLIYASHAWMLGLGSGLSYLIAHGIEPYLRYLPFFALGVLLRTAPDLRPGLIEAKGWTLPLLALSTALLAAGLRGREGMPLELAYSAVDGIAAILMSLTLIGLAARFFDRQNHKVDRIVDASFTIYLLHHPIIYGLTTLFLLATWPPVLEFLFVCIITLFLSYGAHRLIRLSPLALFLFNGVPLNRSKPLPTRPDSAERTLR